MKISFNLNSVILALCIIAFFPPSFFDFTPNGVYLTYLFIAIKAIVSIWFGFVYLIYRKKNALDFLILLFLLSQIISANQTATLTFGFLASQIFLFGFYIFVRAHLEDNPHQFLRVLFNVFMSYIMIQVATQIIYVNGFDPHNVFGDFRSYFIGRKNGSTPYLMYTFVSFYLLNGYGLLKMSVREIVFLTFIITLAFLTKSSTAIMCIGIAALMIYTGVTDRIGTIYTKIAATVYIFLSAIILSTENRLISSLMGFVFGKSSFSGRTNIWQLAIKYFRENMWFGYGLNISFVPWTNGVVIYSAHNTLLDILARYGIFTGIFFLVIIAGMFFGKSRIKSRILLAFLISYLLYCLMENSSILFFILIVSTIYYLNNNEDIYEKNY